MVRSERFNLRLDETEAAMLRELGDALGVGGSGAVRLLIRQAHERKFGAQPRATRSATRPKPKRR
jgi:hypothetical protein